MLWNDACVADFRDDLIGFHAELAADGVDQRGAYPLPHFMSADAEAHLAVGRDHELGDDRHDDARIGAERHAPADVRAIGSTHRLRRHASLAPAEQRGATRQTFADMARGEW